MAAKHDAAVLSLDVGTSSCRASLYDCQARPIPETSARITYTAHVTPDGGAELDPEQLVDNVSQTIDQVLNKDSDREILAVATSTFWHSLMAVGADGKPLTPVYLWLDGRARGEMSGLRRDLDEREIHARTGCVLHATYWPARLRWLKHTQPETFKRANRWVSFAEYLLQRLTGSSDLSVSMASGTGLLDVHALSWYAPLLEYLEITPQQLGPLTRLNESSTSTRMWSRLERVPCFPAVGDGACSNLGAGCASPDRFALMIGTSGAERAVWSPSAHFSLPWGLWGYRVDERRVVMGGALNDGGSLMDWLRDSLQLPDLKAADAELASMAPDSHGLTVLPFWGGERNPGWAEDARGAIIGLRLSTSPAAIVRACMEAVALRFAEMDRLLRQALPDASEVIATGGALLHSPTWTQIIADALGRELLVSAEAEASSRGAALLGLEAVGALENRVENTTTEVTRRFTPVPEHTEVYRAAAERQRQLYDALIR